MLDRNLLEEQMRSFPFRWGFNIILATVLFLLAKFGSFVGIKEEPLPISILWPASGVSLAAILLFGFESWVGIFLGIFWFDLYTLHDGNASLPITVVVSIVMALGCLFQALMGGIIMRSLCSSGYFNTVRDVIIFLIPAGILTCLISCTVGTLTLGFYKSMGWSEMFSLWLTFWLGDTMGVYIFTPFLVVWLIHKIQFDFQSHSGEAAVMGVFFLIILLLSLVLRFPIGLLFVPLILWITYRFRMHGATLANMITSVKVIITSYLGYSGFVFLISHDPGLVVISFLLVVMATTLIFGAVVGEKEEAWNLLQDSNKDLQKEVQKHTSEIKEMANEVYIKEKLASLGVLASGIGRELKGPLVGIDNYTTASLDCLNLMQKIFSDIKEKLDPGITLSLRNDFEILEKCLHSISHYEKKAFQIVSMLQEQTTRTSSSVIEIKSINLHTLLNRCIDQVINDETKKNPEFNITIIKEFDKTVTMLQGFPQDLTHAFIGILDHNLYSIKTKMKTNLPFYEPVLKVSTEDAGENVTIIFHDNGNGVSKNKLTSFFESFSNIKTDEGESGIALSMTYDILVQEHRGDVDAESIEGEFLQIKVILPKSLKRKKMSAE